jgi:hypothetical protein
MKGLKITLYERRKYGKVNFPQEREHVQTKGME